ncbi:cytochrome c oxidase subunit II [Flavobacteriaceae bacterium]|jgi:cytochrome c oxidase subunit 2|nr:cytochrome c oxidase subunit II [Flavobacteriaceae bacterium]MDA9886600.1 cytochrome c oxidase subunit II [Flavobacteriaceae bacterium]MDA9984890.1 cytochrome c oxidase subunit II [Flavobacteriaceae bacterium]MDB2672640.1 cytochrome c oxidase subunit II [Flavobacteriaceae bacterium]MDB4186549.1 cytochrome c oxidase subunit II [Flavobacteriaceae bacterium]
MTAILTLTVLVLIGISIWQISKMFDLSQTERNTSQVANDNDNNTQGKLMFAFLVFIYLLTLYSFYAWGDVLLPEAASEHGSQYDNLMWISFALIFFVQTVTQALLYYFSYKYRGQKGKKALFYADNDVLEAIWTIIPVITLAGLILYGLYTWTTIMTVEENDEALVVELYAQQFNWKARYSGQDGVLGDANVRFLQDFDGKNQVGIDATDPNGLDDVIVQELHLPVGREIIFKMRSQDVLHSAYMPHFRAQMNCVPGMITEFAFTPVITTDEMRQKPDMIAKVKKINKIRVEKSKALVANGEEALEPYTFDYLLLCNKICGASHYNMQMKIIVETPEEYEKWIAQQPTFAQVIQ